MTLQQEKRVLNRAKLFDFIRMYQGKTADELAGLAEMTITDTLDAIQQLLDLEVIEYRAIKMCAITKESSGTIYLTNHGSLIMSAEFHERKCDHY